MLPLGICRHIDRRHYPRYCRVLQADSELFQSGQPGQRFNDCSKNYAVGGDAGEFLLQQRHAAQLTTRTTVLENGERCAVRYEECSQEWTT